MATTTRMTHAIRDAVVAAALSHRFSKETAACQKARTALADALYNHTHGTAERVAKRLPAGWVDSSDSIIIDHEDFVAFRGGRSPILKLSRPRLIPSGRIKVDKDHPFHKRLADLAARETALDGARIELRAKLRSLVYTFNTAAKLFEAWPEGKRFLPKDAVAPATGALVPVKLAGEVNALLGIKAKEPT